MVLFFFFFHFFFIRYGISSWLLSSVASPVTQASIVTSCPPTPCHLSRTPARSKAILRETILDGGVFSLTVYPWVYCYFLCAPRYLDSVRPLLTPEEYKETEAVSTLKQLAWAVALLSVKASYSDTCSLVPRLVHAERENEPGYEATAYTYRTTLTVFHFEHSSVLLWVKF